MAVALYGGLLRVGLPLPGLAALESIHGPLMICGVFGTLISLERAVAIGLAWPYAAPICFGLAAMLMISGVSIDQAAALSLMGSAVFLVASIWIVSRQRALFTAVLLLAAVMLSVGCVLWLGGAAVRSLVGWWLGFLLCTIAAERLELSRVITQTRIAQVAFVGTLLPVFAGAAIGLDDELGGRIFAVGLLATAAWLARHDVARRTIRLRGQSRFMAAAMLAGYAWVAIAGLVLLAAPSAPFAYDLTLHAVLIGFVISMVFGHALIIFPAITGLMLRYRPALYLPLFLLHLSMALRTAGDLLEIAALRMTSGVVTAASLVAFAAIVITGGRTAPTPPRVPILSQDGEENVGL